MGSILISPAPLRCCRIVAEGSRDLLCDAVLFSNIQDLEDPLHPPRAVSVMAKTAEVGGIGRSCTMIGPVNVLHKCYC